MAKELQIVGFRIGRETFGLPISLVHEIVRPPEITNVPHAPEYVEGVMNLRRRFGGAAIENSRKNRVLVVDVESRAVGLIVDSASEVLKISDAQIEPPPNVLTDAATSYVTGVAKHQGRLIILVDLKRILQSGELRMPAATGV
jgi:purine-binding chemotaxis protein CheW